jgi:transposase, IS5 family
MRPDKSENEEEQGRLFERRLDTFLNKKHELYRLSGSMDWNYFEKEFGNHFVEERGRPGLPIRLMVGLTYLKYMYDLSDEATVAQFIENGYWQYFCGYEYFQHEFPCDPSSLVRWRKKIGESGAEKLLQATVETAKKCGLLKSSDVSRVVVDTTVQEKAIAFPTDGRLYHKMRISLVREATRLGVDLRQSYDRVSKHSLAKSHGYAHAKQMKRARKETKKLKTYLGRVVRDLGRKVTKKDERLKSRLALAQRILTQKREDKNKVYSVHAPEVECISKGKAHKRYEFGVKASITTTNKKGFIIGAMALPGNPFDGHTLKEAILQAEKISAFQTQDIFVDKGYRGANHWPDGKNIYTSGRSGLKASLKKWLRRRSAIEPVIGHLKHDHRLQRNHLLGTVGDQINVMLASSAWNIRKIARGLLFALFSWMLLPTSEVVTRSFKPRIA